MTDSNTESRRWSPLQIGVAIIAVVLVMGAFVPFYNSLAEQGKQSKNFGAARQIVTCLKLYAGDHNGAYPDSALPEAKSSNEVFRLLFKEDILTDERIFGAMISPFAPDGEIGSAPHYSKALEAGENHWAMVTGLRDNASALTPVVLENPLTTAPLRWTNVGLRSVKGRTWEKGKIVVAFNDTSVAMVGLVPDPGSSAPLLEMPPDSFPLPSPKGSPPVLDVLE